ncbi:hypothetical protein PAXRUDRAFT_16911 [Paxillus rubicundulus Ve08.2h10]|uniref:Uncharacterized protein n=1 Tax=Paxillus rubicundulus Ve08.2h10 TaxID=930991 RepID=A0A0D0D463_9AGAM|nr:hypothetical protein PAXRUDRAFT_16911 [Paxillus rubicundulus Ve08.2h10]
MQPYEYPPIVPLFMPPMPPPLIQPSLFHLMNNQHPQQQHYVRGVEARVDYTAAVMQATENAHAGRRQNCQRHNAHAAPAPAAPIYNCVNVDFQQNNVINFQQEAEEQQWQQLQWEAQQAERQAAEEWQHVQWAAQQAERQAAEEQLQLQLMAEKAERQAAQEELLRQEADH